MATTVARYAHMLACRKRAFKSKPVKGIVIKKKKNLNYNELISGSISNYDCEEEISSGSYGTVFRARNLRSGEIVAIKKERDGFSKSTLLEINLLKSLKHPRIVEFKQVVVDDDCGDDDDGVYVVMEHLENDLLRYLLEKSPFALLDVKRLMRELLEGVQFLHRNRVMHRDLKPSNVLVNGQGELKICDFGLSCHFPTDSDLVCSPRVGTLWYTAPELLLGGSCAYSAAIDMWAVGCIMAEFFMGEALFRGKTEIQQLDIIESILVLPRDELHNKFDTATSSNGGPVLSECGFDLLCRLLAYDPEYRISAQDALEHEWFDES